MQRNNHLAPDVSLTCVHSPCQALPPTSTTFHSKFAHHGVANAAHKPTYIMTVRVAAFSPTKTPRGCSVQLDQCQSLPSPLRLEESISSSDSSCGPPLVLYCSTSPESSVTLVHCSSSLFLTEFALWATKNIRNLLPVSHALWVSLGIILQRGESLTFRLAFSSCLGGRWMSLVSLWVERPFSMWSNTNNSRLCHSFGERSGAIRLGPVPTERKPQAQQPLQFLGCVLLLLRLALSDGMRGATLPFSLEVRVWEVYSEPSKPHIGRVRRMIHKATPQWKPPS